MVLIYSLFAITVSAYTFQKCPTKLYLGYETFELKNLNETDLCGESYGILAREDENCTGEIYVNVNKNATLQYLKSSDVMSNLEFYWQIYDNSGNVVYAR